MLFADQRQNWARCGMQKNRYKHGYCSRSLLIRAAGLVVGLTCRGALKEAGFYVKTDDQNNKPNSVNIEGSLIKFFIEPVIGFWSIAFETDIHVKLTAASANGLNAEQSFFVKESNTAITDGYGIEFSVTRRRCDKTGYQRYGVGDSDTYESLPETWFKCN